MLGYTTLGAGDIDRAKRFYDQVLQPLGATQLMPLRRGVVYGTKRPCLAIMTPFNGQAPEPGNGTMTALLAPSRAVIQAVHAKALALGAEDEGAPGLRDEDPNGFYAAYFRDLDGNKLCIYRYGAPDAD